MAKRGWIAVVMLLPLIAACHGNDDDGDIGLLYQGESRHVEVRAEADVAPFHIDECISAEVVAVHAEHNPNEQLGDNITAVVDGVVEQVNGDECQTKVRITAQPDAVVDTYRVEVDFLYEDLNDSRDIATGFVELDVAKRKITRTPTRTPRDVSPTPFAP